MRILSDVGMREQNKERTIVAIVLLKAPTTNALPGVIFSPGFKMAVFNLSNIPYVIAGLIVKTNEGFNPLHNPVIPSSARISRTVWKKVVEVLASCCRVAITETGIVKS